MSSSSSPPPSVPILERYSPPPGFLYKRLLVAFLCFGIPVTVFVIFSVLFMLFGVFFPAFGEISWRGVFHSSTRNLLTFVVVAWAALVILVLLVNLSLAVSNPTRSLRCLDYFLFNTFIISFVLCFSYFISKFYFNERIYFALINYIWLFLYILYSINRVISSGNVPDLSVRFLRSLLWGVLRRGKRLTHDRNADGETHSRADGDM